MSDYNPNRAQMELLREAGQTAARELLPQGLTISYNRHVTGFQVSIYGEGLLVWYGSEWTSPEYDFNDAGKVLGIQPDMEFMQPTLNDYFAALVRKVDAKREIAAQRAAAATAEAERDKQYRLARLRFRFQGKES